MRVAHHKTCELSTLGTNVRATSQLLATKRGLAKLVIDVGNGWLLPLARCLNRCVSSGSVCTPSQEVLKPLECFGMLAPDIEGMYCRGTDRILQAHLPVNGLTSP